MRCLECGAEIAERAQACVRCGSWAPVEYQLYVTEDRPTDAAYDAAGGLAPTLIHASEEQQRPESAPDPEVDGAVLVEWVQTQAFSTTRLRPGYDIAQVDAFLGAIRDAFLGREPSLTPDEIRAKQFSTTSLRPGYDEEEVDAFLDEAESRLAAQVSARRESPTAKPEPGAADPATEAVQVRCLECGAETAEPTQICAQCGAPIAQQRPAAARLAAGGPGDPTPPVRTDDRHESADQRPQLAVLLGVIAVVFIVVATIYLAEPAKSLPSFIPGHIAGSTGHHPLKATGSVVVGIVFAFGAWFTLAYKRKPQARASIDRESSPAGRS